MARVNQNLTYLVEWEQRLGLLRGTNMHFTTIDYDTVRYMWKDVFAKADPNWMRNIRFSYKKPRGKNFIPFDPTQDIPKAPRA